NFKIQHFQSAKDKTFSVKGSFILENKLNTPLIIFKMSLKADGHNSLVEISREGNLPNIIKSGSVEEIRFSPADFSFWPSAPGDVPVGIVVECEGNKILSEEVRFDLIKARGDSHHPYVT
ncbi:MAG: hypothetical protein AAB965_00035, partial [Patescibacteria group bacterium]